MSVQRESMGPRDYISNLPDEVLGKILSLLWTNHAARTSVLSKRWRNLLALVDNIELHDVRGTAHDFGNFLERTLSLFHSSFPIKRFSLTLVRGHNASRICKWIRTALELGCMELYLADVGLNSIQPHFFFTSNTVVELTIRTWHTSKSDLTPGSSMIFPALKKLSLRAVEFKHHDLFIGFISSFPLLEDLSLHYSEDEISPHWSGSLSNPSIKRLTIFNHYPHLYEIHVGVRFHTPSLEYLDYSSYVEAHYEVDLASLEEARLDLRSWYRPDDESYVLGDATGLVKGIANVKTLHLSPDSLEVFHISRNAMPVFSNLLTLSFESDKERGWQVVPLLINKSPNLETLVIKGLVHQVTNRCGDACVCIPKNKKNHKVCCLSTCRVKVLEISGYQGTCREREQMSHFLANLKCLETVKVKVELNRQESNRDDYLNITSALLKLPRISSNCQIHFF